MAGILYSLVFQRRSQQPRTRGTDIRKREPEMSQRQVIATDNAPKAIGPYSQAIRANGFIFVSGQTPADPVTQQLVAGNVSEQTERTLRNIEAILKQAGSSMAKIVRCGVFLKDMNDFAAMNEVYASYFAGDPPARTTVQAARLPRDIGVEIDVIAYVA